MKLKAIIEERIKLLQGMISQSGKKYSAATIEKIKKAIDTLSSMIDVDETTEEAVEQAFSPIGSILLQAVITGESTADSYERITGFLNKQLRESDWIKQKNISYPWVFLTWPDHIVFCYTNYENDSWETKTYRADYVRNGEEVIFSNFTEWSIEEVGIAVQAEILQADEKNAMLQLEQTPEAYLLEHEDGKPYLIQVVAGNIKLLQTDQATGKVTFSGIATHGNVKNSAGIVYPTALWQNHLPQMQEKMTEGRFYGADGHKMDARGKPRAPMASEITHKFINIDVQGDLMPFTAETTSTTAGKELAAILQDDIQLEMSTVVSGTLKKGEWQGETVPIVQDDDSFECHYIDVVSRGASPGSVITDVKLQSLMCAKEPEKETAMSREEILALIQEAMTAGDNAKVALLQGQLDALKLELEQAKGGNVLSSEDQALLQRVKDAEILQARDAKIVSVVNDLVQKNELPEDFKVSAVAMLQTMAATEAEVDSKIPAMKRGLAPMMQFRTEAQSKGFYMSEYNDDKTRKGNIESLQQGIDELLDSAEERGLIQKDERKLLPFEGPDGEQLRDFGSMRQNLTQMSRTLVEEFPEIGHAYMQLRNGKLKNIPQSVDLLSAHGAKYLSQVGEGTVKADIAVGLPYLLPMMLELWPQLVVDLFATTQPINKSGGRIYYTKHRYDDTHGYISDPANFTGSYANNSVENSQVKYIDMEITSQNIAPDTKKLGWKASANVIRNLQADFGIDARSDLVRMCSGLIAMEWNYIHLSKILQGATAGNVNYGTLVPTSNVYDAEQWHKQFHRHVQKARGLIWKKTFADTSYVFGDSDSIDRIIDSAEVGTYSGNGRGTMARGVDIVGSLSSGETLVKVAWWDSLTGFQNKLIVAGRGNTWPETGYVIAPYLGLYMTPEHIDPDYQQHKQSMMSEVADKMVNGNYFATVTIQPGTAGTQL